MKAPWRKLLRLFQSPPAKHAHAGAGRSYRPHLEWLEDRLAPAAHDTLATAIPLQFEFNRQADVSGALSDPNQVDLYRIQLPLFDTGRLTASVAPADGSVLLPRLALFSDSGQLLIQSDAAGPDDSARLTQHLQPGGYYLAVSAAIESGGLGNRSYVLDTTFDPSLAPFQPLPENNASKSVVGDFNHDGNLDIALADFNDSRISTFLGQGDGTFRPAGSFDAGVYPYALAVGADPSGNLDIIAASGASSVSVSRGRGNGTFFPAATYQVLPADINQTGETITSVAVGDFTHDGNLDIVTGNGDFFNAGTVSVLLGQSDGTFLPAVSYGLGTSGQSYYTYTSVAVGYLSHDDNLDIVTCNSGYDSVSVLLGQGDGTFLPAVSYSVGSTPRSVAVGDFNHDGNLDIVTGNSDGTVSVLLGRGDGRFFPAVSYPLGSGNGSIAVSVAVADITHDGNLDIITSNGDFNGRSTVSVLLGRGDGTFLHAITSNVGSNANSIAVAEFNHDGNTDIVEGNSILRGRGDGTFQSADSFTVDGSPTAIAAGDFNHDGNLDIVTVNQSSVSVLLGRGDGTFLPAVNYSGGGSSVVVGDLNHDGNLDIVTCNGNAVSVLFGRGDGTFLPAVSYSLGVIGVSSLSYATSVAVGDLNHDGILDIVTTNVDPVLGTGTVSVLLGRGDGSYLPAVTYGLPPDPQGHGPFQLGATYGVAPDPTAVAVEDFNDDGNLDIVVGSSGFGTTSVLVGQGDGTFSPGSILPYDILPDQRSIVYGDFNNDGIVDQATIENGNNVSVSLGEGHGRFRNSTPDNGIAINHIPYFGNLGPGLDNPPDSLILSGIGDLLFRRGLSGDSDNFAPPVVINEGRPARDFTVFYTRTGPAIAAIDKSGNTVSIYTWSGADPKHPFVLSNILRAGNLPVRIAAADLNGDGLDDLVVGNDFDNSVSVFFQSQSGQFSAALTRQIGVGPSAITFADLGGGYGSDIVISDQVSGDVSVLHNDPTHSFSRQSRYRAANGLFDIDTSQGEQTIVSRHQTIGVVADDFTGSGLTDLVVVNRGDDTFTLLPNQGQGRFTDPQPGNSYFTSVRPSQVVSFRLPGDQLPSVAILMEDRNQIWIYRNNGDGTFAPPTLIDAGNDARGFSVATVDGQPALLVGNEYGDILTLLYDGQGGFAPDRANLIDTPLAVGKDSSGRQFVVVADQKLDQASVYYRKPGTNQFDSPIPINSQIQPLLAPGAVQLFRVPGDPNPYLVVANSLSNNVLVYHGRGNGQFDPPDACTVGFNPVSVTVADLSGDGVPDLLVANQGSNDVSVLIGTIAPGAGRWTATPYQRLQSGGSGPISVVAINSNSPHGPDLLVTNSDGKVSLLPGIGSGGKGSGFFQDTNQPAFDPGSPIFSSVVDPRTGQVFVLGGGGVISLLNGNSLTPIFGGDVTAVGDFDGILVAGLRDGSIDLLSAAGKVLAHDETGFTDQISALDVLQNGSNLDVFVTQTGNDVPAIVSFPIPIVSMILSGPGGGVIVLRNPPTGVGTSLTDLPLVLVATLLPGGLSEPDETTTTIPIEQVAQLLLPTVLNGGAGEGLEAGATERVETKWDLVGWESYSLGATEALNQRLLREQASENLDDLLDAVTDVFYELRNLFNHPAPRKTSKAEQLPEAIPSAVPLADSHLDTVPDRSERPAVPNAPSPFIENGTGETGPPG
jgi:hypothetical protein